MILPRRLEPHRPLIRQFSTFVVIGFINTTISFITYALLTRVGHQDPLVANALAFIVAVTVSFILNRRYTFRGSVGRLHRQYAQFMTVNLIALGLSELIIAALHKGLGVHDILAYFIAVGIVLFWNFGANRYWTFRSNPDKATPS